MTKYHLVGIKGSGMSALAQVLEDMGYAVQGSDVTERFFTQIPLEEKGIKILPFHASNIEDGMCVIASNAFSNEHEEIAACQNNNIPLYRYHDFLGEFVQGFTNIAVTGAHGKTSTTGLLAHVLSGIKPTSFLIGDGTGKGEEGSKYFVFEACEYRRHFLAYEPDYAIITNIDFDHPDYFSGIDDVTNAFQQLASQVKKRIVACGDDQHTGKLKSKVPILYYGFGEHNQLQAKNVQKGVAGVSFDVYYEESFVDTFTIPMFGKHHILNTLAVIGICLHEDLNLQLVKERLQSFQGVKRRFSEKSLGSNIVIDDYAHHPTEIRVTIEAARAKYPEKEIVAIFQPHTYSRTEKFLDEFAEALSTADHIYVCDIFSSARESKGNLTIDDLLQKIPGAQLISEKSVHKLKKYRDAVLLFMGAGDIQKVQQAFEVADQLMVNNK